MNPLLDTQGISYFMKGELISLITPYCKIDIFESAYLRYSLPFLKTGDSLHIIRPGWANETTSRLARVERYRNTMLYSTTHCRYLVQFANVDLERMLREGKGKGMNTLECGIIKTFPLNREKESA